MQNPKRSSIVQVTTATLVIALLLLLVFVINQPLLAAPEHFTRINWTPETLEITTFPGTDSVAAVSFNSNADIAGASLFITPEVAQFLTIDASGINNVTAGVDYALTTDVTVPSTTPIGVYEGTVHLKQQGRSSRSMGRTIPATLKVIINVVAPSPIVGGIPLEIDSPFFPGEMISSEPNDAVQVSSAFTFNPYQEFSIIAVPFGTYSPIESLPEANSGGAEAYRTALSDFRIQQGATPMSSPAISLFGQSIIGSYSVVNLLTGGSPTAQQALIVEWVVEAESQLWIIRIARDLSDGTDPTEFLNLLQSIEIDIVSSTALVFEKQSVALVLNFEAIDVARVQAATTLPFPPWWSGNCNVGNHPGSYQLGSPFDGLVACGPIRTARLVYFFPGARGQYEWQCAELVKRYLYLKYGISPYRANGLEIVDNIPNQYIGTIFERVTNGTPNKGPSPGDVISTYGTSSYGHTAVVTTSNITSSGNGWIEIMDQNWGSTRRRIDVHNWIVGSGRGPVKNWLHAKQGGPSVLETLTVPIGGNTVTTSFSLQSGKTYTVRASGDFEVCQDCWVPGMLGPNGEPATYDYTYRSDAEFSAYGFFDYPWRGTSAYLEVNGTNPNFGPFSANHIYNLQYVGTGQPVSFRFHGPADYGWYYDSADFLTVEILE